MSRLKRLQISSLRNLNSVSLPLSPKVNLLYGENGSGKTSFLEAISFLGLGRSFRSHKIRSIIQYEQQQMLVFAEVDAGEERISMGIQRDISGHNLIRINGETIASAAHLAHQLPLQLINADSFQLLEGSPSQRRRFLDWLTFHVKPDFISAWKQFQRAIKQRNSLLKHDKITRSDLLPWDKEFIPLAQQIHKLRSEVFSGFLEQFEAIEIPLKKQIGQISIRYTAGWDLDQDLKQVLDEDFDRDRRDGYTHHGPQKADLKLSIGGRPAMDVLSRGQEKALICTLHIAQAQHYKAIKGKTCTFLIDDMLAELDESNASLLVDSLDALDGQVFVTGIQKDALKLLWSSVDDSALFHVKQGEIITVTDSSNGITKD